MQDLNEVQPWDADCLWTRWDERRTRRVSGGGVTAHFGDLTSSVVEFIQGAELIVGCVAWLTSTPILDALADTQVAIVVQKEDFLRPDINPTPGWKAQLHERYARLREGPGRGMYPAPLGACTTNCDPSIEPVRCVGHHNRDQRSAIPRAHHKFVLRCRVNDRMGHLFSRLNDDYITPEHLWTGSFNFSANGGRSLENAISTANQDICAAYFDEFCRVAAISEPLDWETEWATPEWRLGT
jgi:hypothetical protein